MNEGISQQESKKDLTIEEAEIEIQVILQDIYRAGNNDREYSDIKNILKDLKEGRCSPQEAVNRAQAIFESKNLR